MLNSSQICGTCSPEEIHRSSGKKMVSTFCHSAFSRSSLCEATARWFSPIGIRSFRPNLERPSRRPRSSRPRSAGRRRRCPRRPERRWGWWRWTRWTRRRDTRGWRTCQSWTRAVAATSERTRTAGIRTRIRGIRKTRWTGRLDFSDQFFDSFSNILLRTETRERKITWTFSKSFFV